MLLIRTLMMIAAMENAPFVPMQDTVVILHGIGHSRWNMYRVERAMRKEGYATFNITYPSLKKDIPALAGFVRDKLADGGVWDRPGRVHFVTHSMGGLVVQRYLEDYKSDVPQDRVGRVVMIAPPIGGSEVADLLKNFPPYKWIFGPAGQQLTTKDRQAETIVPWYETGIIAGTSGWPYFIADRLIEGDHDGRVAVEKAKMAGMKDFMTVPATHSFISWKGSVHKQAINFLKNGQFAHDKP